MNQCKVLMEYQTGKLYFLGQVIRNWSWLLPSKKIDVDKINWDKIEYEVLKITKKLAHVKWKWVFMGEILRNVLVWEPWLIWCKSQTTMILNWLYWIETARCYELSVPRKAIGNVVSSNIGAHNTWKCSFYHVYNNSWRAGVQGSLGRLAFRWHS